MVFLLGALHPHRRLGTERCVGHCWPLCALTWARSNFLPKQALLLVPVYLDAAGGGLFVYGVCRRSAMWLSRFQHFPFHLATPGVTTQKANRLYSMPSQSPAGGNFTFSVNSAWVIMALLETTVLQH